MSKIIAFTNHKGGVGKTTSALNISSFLCQADKSVLLIDLDPQTNISLHLGINDTEQNIYNSIKQGELVKPFTVQNIDIIPASLDLAGAEMELSGEAGREYILKELLSDAQAKYDYILLDCPPSLGLLTLNALTASNIAIIPVQAEFLAVKGVTKIVDIIHKVQRRLNPSLSFYVMVTRYSQNKVLNRNVLTAIEETYKTNYIGFIRENIAIAEASATGTTINDYSPKSAGATDYNGLTQKILEL